MLLSSSLILGPSRPFLSTFRFWRCYLESAAYPRITDLLLTLWATSRVRDPRRKSKSMSYYMPQHWYHPPVTVILGDEAVSPILSELRALTVANAPAVDGAPQAAVARL